MKILISLSYFEPNISGVTIYAKRLAQGLLTRGHQVTILTSRYQQNLPKKEKKAGLTIIRDWVAFSLGKGVIMPLFPFTSYRLVKEADVVNCHLPQFEAIFLALWAKILGKKLILTHHTDLSGWSGFFNRLSEGVVNLSQTITASLADKIVAYTKDYADHSRFLTRFRQKLVFVYPPVVVAKPDKIYQRKLSQKLSGVKYRIGFSGRIARQKGLPILLKSIPFLKKELASFKIILAGPKKVIGEDFAQEITPEIKKYSKNLLFLGALNQKQLAAFYQTIDLLVLPSDDTLESFGIVQVEAMLFGKPVVAPNLPGVREPIKKTGFGKIFLTGDPSDLAKKIISLLSDPKIAVDKNKVKEVFSYKKTIDCYDWLFGK
ncbi:MAG: Glycosyl transferase group 1 [Microgenomates bacterium 39_6]|nr:MAG: Glycosyl transferase group 1 [Microgenomates bacterium 39_6]